MDFNVFLNEFKDHTNEFVKAEAKKAFLLWLNEMLPTVKGIASDYIEALQKSSESENGWDKFRDRVFLPCAVNGIVWLAEKALEGMLSKQ